MSSNTASGEEPVLSLNPSGTLEGANSFPSGGYAFAGSSGCQSLGAFDQPRSSSFVFRTAGSGGVAMDLSTDPLRSTSSKSFFGDLSAADLLDDLMLANRHRRVQGAEDLSPVSDSGEQDQPPSVVQPATAAVMAK